MKNSVEKTGRNVEEAINLALKDLNVNKEDVEVEVIEEEKKGFLGLIKAREAKVRVTIINKKIEDDFKKEDEKREDIKEQEIDKIENILKDIIKNMNVDAEFEIIDEPKVIRITLKGNEVARLVGIGGKTLESLQQILNIISYNKMNISKKILIDTLEYRKKREEYLRSLAKKTADKVVKYKKTVALNPMNSFERMVVHSELQNNENIKTYSVGEEPNRKIVVTLK